MPTIKEVLENAQYNIESYEKHGIASQFAIGLNQLTRAVEQIVKKGKDLYDNIEEE